MYDELTMALRTCVDKDKDCSECPYYERCMNNTSGKLAAMVEAADAIEELSERLNCVTAERDAAMKRLCEWCGVGCSIENRRAELCEIVCVGLEFLEPPKEET